MGFVAALVDAERARWQVCVQGDQVWQGADGYLAARDAMLGERLGLGHWQGQAVALVLVEPGAVPATAGAWVSLRGALMSADAALFHLLALAVQLGHWWQDSRFCGRCATPMQHLPGERGRHCPACGWHHYPRVSPCIIVLVTRGDELLLARSHRYAHTGMFSVLAGFVEPGESLEACVIREVREEVGLEVEAPVYQSSQSWPFPSNLMVGFHARYRSGQIVPQADEILEADWFHPDALPAIPPPFTIANSLIQGFIQSLRANPSAVS